MRGFTALIIASLCLLFAFATTAANANQRHHHRHHLTHKYGRHLAMRHYYRHHHFHHTHLVSHSAALPGPCRVAASMGGPCGCWAAYTLLGRLDHVWRGINLWLADDWMKFPRAPPEEALAAVWPHHHVAPIVPGTYKDGTIVVRDSWKTHRVRTAGLVFVRP
jgi:hypothetical protein